MAQPLLIKDIDDRVKDTGDTMTGALSISRGVNFNQLYLYDQNNLGHAIHAGSETAGDYSDIQLQAKNDVGRTLLVLRNKKSTGDTPYAFIYNDINGSTTSQTLLTHTNFSNYITARGIGAIPSNALDRIQIPGGTEFTDFFNNSDYKTIYGSFFTNTSGIITGTPDDSRSLWWFFEHNPQGFFASNHIDQGKIWYRWKCNSTFSPWYEILHTGNYSSYALPLTGGTITGNVNFNSTINNMLALYPNETVTSGTTAGTRTSLLIYGPTYGNTASHLKEAGRLNWGDPNPQIVFNYSNSIKEGQPLALMYSDNNDVGWGTTLALVSNQGSCGFIAPYIKARTQLQVVRDDVKPAKTAILPILYGSYQNGAGNYYGVDIISFVGTGNTSNLNNGCVMIGTHSGSLQLTAGECGKSMCTTLGLTDTEHIYMTCDGSIYQYVGCANDAASYTLAQTIASNKITAHVPLYGAVWNDYAEFRQSSVLEPGRCIIETGKGDLVLSTERLQPGANIVSDTFGFAIGETDDVKCPIAVAGRVLAYPYEDRNSYAPGDAVCSGPNGTISKMTEEEIIKYPHRIVGTVSEIPEYEVWGSGNVPVNNRIWIKVK